ncbi:MAG: S-layer homology domain-containing protein [Candidatus Margulisbacteria bacterium]|nr:S-layer homology domain-containing protein [Candidatus Margulisiibacteriota bacterium]
MDSIKLPFYDIRPNYWGRNILKVAIKEHLITPKHRFYPERRMTRAHALALMAKTPQIKAKLLTLSPRD